MPTRGDNGLMSATKAEIESAIATMITDELGWSGDPDTLVGGSAVKLANILDSAALLELASAVEVEYDIEIDDLEISPETFDTVESLAALVQSKLPGAA